MIFNTYFVFVYTALFLLLAAPTDAEESNLNTIMVSWSLLIVCVVCVPSIIVHAALQPDEVRQSKKYELRYGTLFKDMKSKTLSQRLYRV